MEKVTRLSVEELESRIAPMSVLFVSPGAEQASASASVPAGLPIGANRPECHPVGSDLVVCTL